MRGDACRAGRRRDLLIGAGVAAALVAVFAFVMFGTGPLHLPATIETAQSKGNGQSIPGFIGTHLGLGTVGLPAALALGALFAAVLCWLLWRVWCGRLDWIVGGRLGGDRAAGQRRVARAVVRGVADAAGGARTGPPPVAGLDPAHGRDRVLRAARLHPPRAARCRDCEPIVTSLDQPR